MLCSYGCGREAIHQFKNGNWCCSKYLSQCSALKEKNSKGNKGKKIVSFSKIDYINKNILCENGCGDVAKYITKTGKKYCSNNHRKCLINRQKNSKGHKNIEYKIGKDHPLYGKKRPEHSNFIKNNNPMSILEVKEKHLKICNSIEYKQNMSKIIIERWKSKKYRKMYSDSLIQKGLKRSDETISKQQLYYRKVLNITKTNLDKYYHLINPDNKPMGQTENTYNIDHIFSISEGFKQNIDPKIIGSVYNLQTLLWKDNIRKNKKCWITKEKLMELYYENII